MNRTALRVQSLFLVFLAALSATQAEAPQVLFYVPFEQTTRGLSRNIIHEDIYRPRGAAQPIKIQYEKGIIGNGALLSWDGGYPGICYPNRGNINPKKGTISLWLKWTRPIFINRYYPNIWVCLSKEGTASPVALVGLEDKRLASTSEDQKWHHFVYTWDIESEARHQYLDGKLLASGSITAPVYPKLLVFGFRLPGALDELVILDRSLSSDETLKAFKDYKSGRAPFAIQPSK
jgi:hypothetical protein